MGIVTLKNGKEVSFTKQISRSELHKLYPEFGYAGASYLLGGEDFGYFIEQKAGMSSKRLVTVRCEDISIVKYDFE